MIAELLFLSLNNWGLNFLQIESSQFSQIYLSPEKLRKMFTFQSCKFLNDQIDPNTNFAAHQFLRPHVHAQPHIFSKKKSKKKIL